MTYKINRTDGTLVTDLIDSSINTSSTDITLIGKNVPSYGEYINENFVKLLENFASRKSPAHPSVGQIWYDTNNNRLKVYTGSEFKNANSPIVSEQIPTSLATGDLWINSSTNQLWFYDGQELTLAGPIFNSTQGLSGFTTETVLDTKRKSRTIVKLWLSNTLLGIFSSDADSFELLNAIPGFTGLISQGFTQSKVLNFRFDATVESTLGLMTEAGVVKTPKSFMAADANTGTIGTVTIENDTAIVFGPASDVSFNSTSTEFSIDAQTAIPVKFTVKTSTGLEDAIAVETSGKVGIFKSAPTVALDVAGSFKTTDRLTIGGPVENRDNSDVQISTEYVKLNFGESGLGVSNTYSGIIVDRGSLPDVALRWNELTTKWEVTTDGTNFGDIVTSGVVSTVAITNNFADLRDVPASGIWVDHLNGIYFDAGNVGIKNPSVSTDLDVAGTVKSTSSTVSWNTTTGEIDLSTGNFFTISAVADVQLLPINLPTAGAVKYFVLEVINGGSYAITWWDNISWVGGAPSLTTGKDVIGFFTKDGGISWSGLLLGKDFKSGTLLNWVALLYNDVNFIGNKVLVDGSGTITTVNTIESAGTYDVSLVKFNSSGLRTAQKVLHQSTYETPTDVFLTGSGYIVGIETSSGFAILKITSSGVITYQQEFKSPVPVTVKSFKFVETTNSVFVMIAVNDGTRDTLNVFKILPNELLDWTKVLSASSKLEVCTLMKNDAAIFSIVKTIIEGIDTHILTTISMSSGNLISQVELSGLAGNTILTSILHLTGILILSKLPSGRLSISRYSTTGSIFWKLESVDMIISTASITPTIDGMIVVAKDATQNLSLVMSISATGTILWQRTISNFSVNDVATDPTGNVVMTGSSTKFLKTSLMLVKIPATAVKTGTYDVNADSPIAYLPSNILFNFENYVSTEIHISYIDVLQYPRLQADGDICCTDDGSYVFIPSSYAVNTPAYLNYPAFVKFSISTGEYAIVQHWNVTTSLGTGHFWTWMSCSVYVNGFIYLSGECGDDIYDRSFIAKMDATTGQIIWFKAISDIVRDVVDASTYYSYAWRIVATPDGLFATHYVDDVDQWYGAVIKMDYNGNLQWIKELAPDINWYSEFYYITHFNGNVYASGEYDLEVGNEVHASVFKIDTATSAVDSKCLLKLGAQAGWTYGIQHSATHLYTMVSTGGSVWDLVKFDENWNIARSIRFPDKLFGDPGLNIWYQAFYVTPDTGDIYVLYSEYPSAVHVIKLDSNLNLIYTKQILYAAATLSASDESIFSGNRLLLSMYVWNNAVVNGSLIFPWSDSLSGSILIPITSSSQVVTLEVSEVTTPILITDVTAEYSFANALPTELSTLAESAIDVGTFVVVDDKTSLATKLISATIDTSPPTLTITQSGVDISRLALYLTSNSSVGANTTNVVRFGPDETFALNTVAYSGQIGSQIYKMSIDSTFAVFSTVIYKNDGYGVFPVDMQKVSPTEYVLISTVTSTPTSYMLMKFASATPTVIDSQQLISYGTALYAMSTALTLDNGVVVAGKYTQGNWESFVSKVSSNLTPIWQKSIVIDTITGLHEETRVVVSSLGNVFVTGAVNGVAFLVKISSDGTVIWTKTFGYPSELSASVRPMDIVCTSTEEVYVVAVDTAGTKSFLLKFSSSGDLLIQKDFASTLGSVYITSIALHGTAVFLSGTVLSLAVPFPHIIRLDSDVITWINSFTAERADITSMFINSIVVDSENSVLLVGVSMSGSPVYGGTILRVDIGGSTLGSYYFLNSWYTYNRVTVEVSEVAVVTPIVIRSETVLISDISMTYLSAPTYNTTWGMALVPSWGSGGSQWMITSVMPVSDGFYFVGNQSYFCFVGKVNRTADIVMVKRIETQVVARAAVLSSNHIYIVAYYGYTSSQLIKLDLDLNKVFSAALGDATNSIDCYSICESPTTGNLGITGTFYSDMLITVISPTGEQLFAKTLYGVGSDYGWGVVADSLGNWIITGAENGNYNMFVVKLDLLGNIVWKTGFNSSWPFYFKEGQCITRDHLDNIYVVGGAYSYESSSRDTFIMKFDSSGNNLWKKVLGLFGNDEDRGNSVAYYDNNVYVVGKMYQSSLNQYYSSVSKISNSGDLVWSKTINTSINGYYNELMAVAIDSRGYLIVGGMLPISGYETSSLFVLDLNNPVGSGNFNGSVISVNDIYPNFYNASAVSSSTSNLTMWDSTYNGSWITRLTRYNYYQYDYSIAIARDSNSNLYVGSMSNNYVQLTKLSPSGTIMWTKGPSSTASNSRPDQVLVDSSNDIYMICKSADIVHGTSTALLMIIKFNSNGTILWNKPYLMPENQSYVYADYSYKTVSAVFNSAGNLVIVAGGNGPGFRVIVISSSTGEKMSMTAIMDPSRGNAIDVKGAAFDSSGNLFVSSSFYDGSYNRVLVVKLDLNFNIMWSKTIGATYYVYNYANCAVDSLGNLIIAAYDGNNADTVILKLDTAGAIVWQYRWVASGTQSPIGMVLDSSDNIYITGQSNSKAMILKFSSTCSIIWQKELGPTNDTAGYSILLDPAGFFVVSGHTYYSSYYYEGFVFKLPISGVGPTSISTNWATLTYTTTAYSTTAITYTATNYTLLKQSTIAGSYLVQFHATITFDSYKIDMDSLGNVYLIGSAVYSGTTMPFIAKVSPAGAVLWTKSYYSRTATHYGKYLVIDEASNALYATSDTNSTTTTVNQNTVIKFDLDGNLIWHKFYTFNCPGTPAGIIKAVDGSICFIANFATLTSIINISASSGDINWQTPILSLIASKIQLSSLCQDTSTGNYLAVGYNNMIGTANNGYAVCLSSVGSVLWSKDFRGAYNSDDYLRRAVSDNAGNFYVVGSGWTDYVSYEDVFFAKLTSAGVVTWQNRIKNNASYISDSGYSLALYGGVLYITYYGRNESVGSQYDFLFSAHNVSTGSAIWTRAIGSGSSSDSPADILVDNSYIYISGRLNSSSNIALFRILKDGTGTGTKFYSNGAVGSYVDVSSTVTVSASTFAIADAAVSTTSTTLAGWSLNFAAYNNSSSYFRYMVVDALGNLYFAFLDGYVGNTYLAKASASTGAIIWVSGSIAYNPYRIIVSADSSVIYVISSNSQYMAIDKFLSDGTRSWREIVGSGSSTADMYAATLDSTGNIILAGRYGVAGFVIKLDTTGALIWKLPILSSKQIVVTGISNDGDDLVAVAYDTTNQRCFIFKISSIGVRIWTKVIEATYYKPNDVKVDASGNIYVAISGNSQAVVVKYSGTGTFVWAKALDADSTEEAVSISILTDGVLVVGRMYRSLTGRYGEFAAKYLADGTLSWQKELRSINTWSNIVGAVYGSSYYVGASSAGSPALLTISKLPLDGTGAGIYNPSDALYSLVNGTMTASTPALTENTQQFVMTVFNPSTTSWIVNSSSSNYNYFYAVKMDSLGNIYVSGAQFGEFFVIKFSPTMVVLWQKYILHSYSTDYAYCMDIDSSGNLYVGGSEYHDYTHYTDMYIWKLDSSGNKIWVKRIYRTTASEEWIYSIKASGAHVYIAGSSYNALGTNSYRDLTVMKLTADTCSIVWSSNVRGDYLYADDYGYCVDVDSLGNVYVAGTIYNSANGIKAAVIKYDSAGNKLWNKDFFGNSSTTAKSVKITSAGDVYVAGTLYLNGYYAFLIKLDTSGNVIWQNKYRSVSTINDQCSGMDFDSAGNIYLVGATDLESNGSVIFKISSTGAILRTYIISNHRVDYDDGIFVISEDNILLSNSAALNYGYTMVGKFVIDGTADGAVVLGTQMIIIYPVTTGVVSTAGMSVASTAIPISNAVSYTVVDDTLSFTLPTTTYTRYFLNSDPLASFPITVSVPGYVSHAYTNRFYINPLSTPIASTYTETINIGSNMDLLSASIITTDLSTGMISGTSSLTMVSSTMGSDKKVLGDPAQGVAVIPDTPLISVLSRTVNTYKATFEVGATNTATGSSMMNFSTVYLQGTGNAMVTTPTTFTSENGSDFTDVTEL